MRIASNAWRRSGSSPSAAVGSLARKVRKGPSFPASWLTWLSFRRIIFPFPRRRSNGSNRCSRSLAGKWSTPPRPLNGSRRRNCRSRRIGRRLQRTVATRGQPRSHDKVPRYFRPNSLGHRIVLRTMASEVLGGSAVIALSDVGRGRTWRFMWRLPHVYTASKPLTGDTHDRLPSDTPRKLAASPLAPFSFERRPPGPHDVQIDILYCGVCHSDLHQVRNEWHNTVYPCVPGHEIVGKVTTVGDQRPQIQSRGYRGDRLPGGFLPGMPQLPRASGTVLRNRPDLHLQQSRKTNRGHYATADIPTRSSRMRILSSRFPRI